MVSGTAIRGVIVGPIGAGVGYVAERAETSK
jgi:hypothetical protein